MRISEKSFELSIAAQLTRHLDIDNAIWFGLTQKQEKQWGFDAASVLGGSLFIFQFKASNSLVGRSSAKRRKFVLPHRQLENLQFLASQYPNSVYYLLPDLGTTEELQSNQNLIIQSYLIRVADLPSPLAEPTNRAGVHYAYLDPPTCEVRSRPHKVKALPLSEFGAERGNDTARGMVALLKDKELNFKGRKAYALLLPE